MLSGEVIHPTAILRGIRGLMPRTVIKGGGRMKARLSQNLKRIASSPCSAPCPDAIGAMTALEVIASPRLAEGAAISYYHAAS